MQRMLTAIVQLGVFLLYPYAFIGLNQRLLRPSKAHNGTPKATLNKAAPVGFLAHSAFLSPRRTKQFILPCKVKMGIRDRLYCKDHAFEGGWVSLASALHRHQAAALVQP